MNWQDIKMRLPTRDDIVTNRYLKVFGEHLHDHNLWHFHRRGVARATGIGLFCAFLPMPFEMVVAAIGAIIWRANMPISVAWVWVSNPLTWVPLYAPPYIFGAWLLGQPVMPFDQITAENALGIFTKQLGALWLGCVITGIVLGIVGYYAVLLLWRMRIVTLWRERRERRREKRALRAEAAASSRD